jgi:SAM-dependent methyltransferase
MLGMSDWSHGYNVSMGYSYGFYREMAPDWLDFCAWIGGFESPQRGAGPFRYLELGCGQGFGLCLLAAANPRADFVGVDFQPEHIEHATGLAQAAGLSNVRFVQADFLDLAAGWPDDFGTFDYVTLHGIISYLSPPLLDAVVGCLSHAVAPGGLVYVSYNAQPGCLSTVPLQHFAHRLKETTSAQGAEAVEQSIALLERLRAANAPVFQVLPALAARLEALKTRDKNYLVHEYLTESWNLFWHSDVAREFGRAGLDFTASATLADNLVREFLPAPLSQPIIEQKSEHVRQDLQDFVINQAFRRDIFCRGAQERGRDGGGRDKTPVYAAATVPPGRTLSFQTSFGEIDWAPEVFANILDAVRDGPKPLGELFRLPRTTQWMPRHVLLLLLHANVLALEAAEQGDPAAAQRLNAVIARAVSDGAPYDHLAASRLGSGIRTGDVELMLLDAWLESGGGGTIEDLADGLARRLAKVGRKLQRHGQPIDEAGLVPELRTVATAFVESTVPLWRRLGAIE